MSKNGELSAGKSKVKGCTSDSTATLLLTRSVVVIATAAESALQVRQQCPKISFKRETTMILNGPEMVIDTVRGWVE